MRVCPWYNDSIRATKCLIRQLERRWRTTGLECDRLAYCLQRQLVVSSIHRAKLKYHMCQIADVSGDQKKLCKIVAKLVHTDHDTPLPTCDSFDALVEQFSDFFSENISKIRCEFTPSVSNVDIYTAGKSQTCLLNAFEPAAETEIGILLKSSTVKSCELDPIPTWLLRDCAPDIIHVLTTIVNMSLRTGVMPSHLKRAHVRPIIKKPGLDKDILNNYRPVSNLPYLSKTIERVVAARLSAHISECDLACPTSLRTRQTTASRRTLSVFRMTSCVQWTTRTLSSCYYYICRLHLILLTTTSCCIDMMLEWAKLHLSGLNRI